MTLSPAKVTLGILAGGCATRLDGREKAWLRRAGIPQVQRIHDALRACATDVLVSANSDRAPYLALGLDVVADLHPDRGPIGGLHALACACRTPWLLTVPVDVLAPDPALACALLEAGQPAHLVDDDGVQPLFALWAKDALAHAAESAMALDALSVQRLQRGLGLRAVHVAGRIGNLNTPADLVAAGIDPEP